jgi:hypothetical protein
MRAITVECEARVDLDDIMDEYVTPRDILEYYDQQDGLRELIDELLKYKRGSRVKTDIPLTTLDGKQVLSTFRDRYKNEERSKYNSKDKIAMMKVGLLDAACEHIDRAIRAIEQYETLCNVDVREVKDVQEEKI